MSGYKEEDRPKIWVTLDLFVQYFLFLVKLFFRQKGCFRFQKNKKSFDQKRKKSKKKFHNTICSIEGSLLINKKNIQKWFYDFGIFFWFAQITSEMEIQ